MATGQHSRKSRISAFGWTLLGLGCVSVASFLLCCPSSNKSQIAESTSVGVSETASEPLASPETDQAAKLPSFNPDPATSKLIADLSDPAQSLKVHRRQARELARLGPEQAI